MLTEGRRKERKLSNSKSQLTLLPTSRTAEIKKEKSTHDV